MVAKVKLLQSAATRKKGSITNHQGNVYTIFSVHKGPPTMNYVYWAFWKKWEARLEHFIVPHVFWVLINLSFSQNVCMKNKPLSTKKTICHKQGSICLVNGQWRHQANMRRGDSRERSPLRDLLYSQPGSCLHASGQPSDGWRDERVAAQGGGQVGVSMNHRHTERCQDGR